MDCDPDVEFKINTMSTPLDCRGLKALQYFNKYINTRDVAALFSEVILLTEYGVTMFF